MRAVGKRAPVRKAAGRRIVGKRGGGAQPRRLRFVRMVLAVALLVGLMPGAAAVSPQPAYADSYMTDKVYSDTEYRLYVDKGRGDGDEWNIFEDSFLKVKSGGKEYDVWCVDITQLYPEGKASSSVDALQVMPQAQLTKIALAHDYLFSQKSGSYEHFSSASWAQRYAILQAYVWWIMQHASGTGMANYTIYSIEVLNGEGGWGSRWLSAWEELNNYVDANASLCRGSGTAFVSSEAQTVAAWFSLESLTGSVALQKASSDSALTEGNACYSLAGAVYGIYSDEACSTEVARMTTDAKGYAKANDVCVGNYWVKEITAPAGFALDTAAYPVRVQSGATAQVNGGIVEDAPLACELSLLIGKYDAEKGYASSGNAPQGSASLAGAQFVVRHYGGYYEDASAAETSGDPLRTWTVTTDESGFAYAEEPGDEIDSDALGDDYYRNADGLLVAPLGTYLVQETKAPAGYVLNSEVHVRQVAVGEDGSLPQVFHEVEVPESVVRGDVALTKADGDVMLRMAGIPFEIVSNTTGERHVVVTDENGYASTSSDWHAHSESTNVNDDAADGSYGLPSGIWFGDVGALDDGKGALPFDTYTINELPCAANAGYVLVKGLSVTISRDSRTVDLGVVENSPVRIGTTAFDAETGSHEAVADDEVVIVDTVEYENVTPGERYLLVGTLMDKATGAALLVDGAEVVSRVEFVPESSDGLVDVEFVFDGSALGGSSIVVFESLYRQVGEEWILVSEHEDLQDANQTVQLREPELPEEELPVEGEPYDKTGMPMTGVLLGVVSLVVLAGVAVACGIVRQRKAGEAAGTRLGLRGEPKER